MLFDSFETYGQEGKTRPLMLKTRKEHTIISLKICHNRILKIRKHCNSLTLNKIQTVAENIFIENPEKLFLNINSFFSPIIFRLRLKLE